MHNENIQFDLGSDAIGMNILKDGVLSISHESMTISQPSTPVPDNLIPDVPFHLHNLDGFIQTIDFVPTYKPQRFMDQVVLVSSGGSTRAYFYDTKPSALGWKYTTLT